MQTNDHTKAYKLLRKTGLEGVEANELTNLIGDMASENIVSRFEAKMDSVNAKMDAQNAKIDATNGKYDLMLWLIGIGIALIIASNFIGGAN